MINANTMFAATGARMAASVCAITSSFCRSTILRIPPAKPSCIHQGHDGDPASVWPASVRRGPGAPLPYADRRRLHPTSRPRRDRHRGRLTKRVVDGIAKTGKPGPVSASSSTAITTRSARLESRERIRAVGLGAAARKTARSAISGSRPSAASPIPLLAAGPIRRSAACSTSSSRSV